MKAQIRDDLSEKSNVKSVVRTLIALAATSDMSPHLQNESNPFLLVISSPWACFGIRIGPSTNIDVEEFVIWSREESLCHKL